MLSVQTSERKQGREHECCICILPGYYRFTLLRYCFCFLSEGELHMKNIISVELKLELSGAFLWSLQK